METDPSISKDIFGTIANEAARELEEEIGIKHTAHLEDEIYQKLVSGNFGLMYNNRTAVDRVHLAVAMFFAVDKEEIMANPHEDDVITKGQWMSFDQIAKSVSNGEFEIEHWTRMVINAATISWK